MKFHALTLCLASTLVANGASAEDKMHHDRMHQNQMHAGTMNNDRVDHSRWPRQQGFHTRNRVTRYTQEFPYYKEGATAYGPVVDLTPNYMVYYPDLPSLSYVAGKIQEIHHHNAMEAAELSALANRARSLGWTNIAAVYDQIASDHSKGATMAANWLTDNRFPAPAMPSTVNVSDSTSETDVRNSVDRILDMHVKMYNETLDKLHNEKSSTVRGMYLMNLATMTRHIDWLEMLDRDVDGNRRNLSAQLASEMDATRTTRTASEWQTVIFEEQWALYGMNTNTTVASQTPYVVPPDAEIRIVEKPVIVERIVERPVPAPATTPAPTIATAPAPFETQPAIEQPRSTVAAQRQTRTRRPARRPAK